MRIVSLLFGVVAAVVAGALALFTFGEVVAAAVAIVLLALAIYGLFAPRPIAGLLSAVFPIIAITAISYGGFNAYNVYTALTDEDGPTDPADPAALASARAAIDAIEDQAGFRLELTQEEITAHLLDGLAGQDTPVQRITVSITGGDDDDPRGRVGFDAQFKSGSLTASGSVSYELVAGAIEIDILDLDIGAFTVPGAVRGAIEDIIDTVIDINETLAENRASIQLVELSDGLLVIVGTQAGGELLTSAVLLSALRDNASAVGTAVSPPPERLGPGEVNADFQTGGSFYVALGDSLAANVGVDSPRDGYVSRFHRQLEIRDGRDYGMNNLGVSGETSGSLITSGQLDDALAFIAANAVSYVTIDIGANDLLGHLGSDDCSGSADDPACRTRIDASLEAYRSNLNQLFAAINDAAPNATVIFLQTYNPFSFGLAAVALEAETDEATVQLNAVASEVARQYGVLVADGFTPMRGTTTTTTHMTEAPPDIHPRAIGYDLLAAALLEALP